MQQPGDYYGYFSSDGPYADLSLNDEDEYDGEYYTEEVRSEYAAGKQVSRSERIIPSPTVIVVPKPPARPLGFYQYRRDGGIVDPRLLAAAAPLIPSTSNNNPLPRQPIEIRDSPPPAPIQQQPVPVIPSVDKAPSKPSPTVEKQSSVPPPVDHSQQQQQQEKDLPKKKQVEKGFIDKDGKRRAYETPPPPTIEDIEWTRIGKRLAAWYRHTTRGSNYPRMILDEEDCVRDGAVLEPFALLGGKPDADFYSSKNVRPASTEAEDLLRPLVIARDENQRPVVWGGDVERELYGKGIKLADSNVIDVNIVDDGGTTRKLTIGIRFFFLAYRYFVAVLLGGDFGTAKTEFCVEDRPIVAFYYVALSVSEARLQRCP